jgi:hypothetical protein
MSVQIPAGYGAVGIELRGAGDPDSWYVTFGVDLRDAGGDIEGALNNIDFAWESNWMGNFNESTTFVATHISVGQDANDPLIVTKNNGGTGSGNSAKLPQNCALLVSKNSGVGGRRNRGRFFVPAVLNEGGVSNVGVIDSTLLNGFQDVCDEFWSQLAEPTAVGATPTPMVILHNGSGVGVPAPTTVLSLTADPTISTQRRRLR